MANDVHGDRPLHAGGVRVIPALIHLYWGDTPEPDDLEQTVTAWRDMHPDWDVTLHTDGDADLADLVERARRARDGVYPPDRPRYTANVVRWHLLNAHGGIWVDTDTRPLHPLDDLLEHEAFTAATDTTPTPFVIGGVSGHPAWGRCLTAALANPVGTSPITSGGPLLRTLARPGELELVPMDRFAETDAAGRYLDLPAGATRYCTHTWATSRARHRKGSP